MFYIRADANSKIATGHVMRCLAIAGELKKRGIETTFITADHFADEMINDRGFRSICIDSVWNDMNMEINKMKELIHKYQIEKILIDSYFVTKQYLKELSQDVKIIYIDDLGLINYPVDTIINYNIYAEDIDYCKLTNSNKSRVIVGPEFSPLREEFQAITPVFRECVKAILVTTGGTDNYNIAYHLMDYILNQKAYNDINFYVVSGKMNIHLSELQELGKNHSNIHICSNVQRISEIMCKCDLAISASGTTMYELCACGLPIITFSIADNQLKAIEKFSEKGFAINCGDVRNGVDDVIEQICSGIDNLITDKRKRKNIHKKERDMVDGFGVVRLVNKLLNDSLHKENKDFWYKTEVYQNGKRN